MYVRRFLFLGAALAVSTALAAACDSRPSKPKVAAEPVVARVGDATITARTLADLLAKQPAAVRERSGSPAARRSVLDNQIRLELLAHEARRRGYDRDPAFERAMKQQLISTLLHKEVETQVKPQDIPEAEVQQYYREHAAEFTQPFAAVRGDIRQRLYHRERGRRVDQLLAGIRQRTKVEIDEAALARLAVDARAATTP